jgi:hypothetical protein
MIERGFMTLQEELDHHFSDYTTGSTSSQKYLMEITSIERSRKGEVQKEFGYRKDSRTLAEFAEHMIDQMEIERSIIEHWVKTFGWDYFGGEATFEYSGIYDDARLICESSTTKDKMKMPDVLINNRGKKQYLEIKQCPVIYKATYKTADLKHYHSLGNVFMLTAHTKGKFSADKVEFYTLLTPDALANLLEDGRRGILKSEKRREMGYKKAVQFTRKGLADYFLIQE